ncbi:putative Centrosomal protein of 104 kDa [Nannochloris sp. 'desiccata']|nr:hypothetical protein KSW81_002268 [Chlorella desiccata (nom. nud.)]KAH7623669.1 putative Centrosomal protein of 104 kDa [Chlorella desiccata (nom. nud.)]
MPANIGFTILECSGEDADSPCTELLAHTQDSKGWTTPRNGTFPQHLTLQLEHPSRLQQIQLLSHEYKIAGKIELQVASSSTSTDKSPQEFTRLGFLSFDPNDRTNYAARELKSVTLPDVEATAVKLIIHRCHANTMNTHSQACLIMLNLVGEPLHQVSSSSTTTSATAILAASMPVLLSAPPAPLTNPTSSNSNTSSSSNEENVDEVTAQRISELQEKKAAAVAIEDYDEAKHLKAEIEKLRAAGAKMAALEAKKKAAVDAEDYDTAKALKIELERMRQKAYAANAQGGDHHDRHHHESHSDNADINNSMERMMLSSGQQQQQQAAATPFSPALCSMDSSSVSKSDRHSPEIITSTFMQNNTQQQQRPATSGGASSDWRSYDERPARAAGVYDITHFENLNADSAPPGAVLTSPIPGGNTPLRRIDENADHGTNSGQQTAAAAGETTAAAEALVPCPPAPAGFPSELPLPEPLSHDDAKESGHMEAIIGEFLTRCLYSKSWQLREAGITAMATAVSTSSPDALPRLDGDGDALRLLCGVVAQGLKARIPAIAAAALDLLRSLVRSAAARQLPSRDLHAALSELLPGVAERACDPGTTARTREHAVEALVDISKVKESGLKSLTGIFLKPYKITEFPKITQGRLYLLGALLPVLGVVPNNNSLHGDDTSSSPGGSIGGFSAEAVVQFCCPALKSANAEVRSAAAQLVVKVGRAPGVGPHVVLQLLPVDVNPKLRQQLEVDLTGEQRIRAARAVNSSIKNTSGASNAGVGAATKKSNNAATIAPSVTRRTSNVHGATTASTAVMAATASDNGGAARSQASSRHHSSTSATAAAAAARNRRPPSTSSSNQQQQRQDVYEYNFNNQEERRPFQQPSSRAGATTSMPPPPSQTHAPPQQHEEYKQLEQQQQQQRYLQEDTSTLYTPSVVGAEFSVADEDPAPFEEELRRREATLGPSHPHVAEAASNLAIIYNQRGDGDRALPLYQRALNIWEMTHGPHHPDVAHALTDIAVILLEAGHDVQGKQLLQRALGIQMELLGPMHPDVVAIKDVLNED